MSSEPGESDKSVADSQRRTMESINYTKLM